MTDHNLFLTVIQGNGLLCVEGLTGSLGGEKSMEIGIIWVRNYFLSYTSFGGPNGSNKCDSFGGSGYSSIVLVLISGGYVTAEDAKLVIYLLGGGIFFPW